jgi:uncharacterized membrane protein
MSAPSKGDQVADAITRFAGSLSFVYLHIGWFVAWVLANTAGPPGVRFDGFPFGLLTLVVSLEAIFLATFVMISQNRESQRADARAHLDYMADIRSEAWIEAVAAQVGVDLAQVRRDVELRLTQARHDELA